MTFRAPDGTMLYGLWCNTSDTMCHGLTRDRSDPWDPLRGAEPCRARLGFGFSTSRRTSRCRTASMSAPASTTCASSTPGSAWSGTSISSTLTCHDSLPPARLPRRGIPTRAARGARLAAFIWRNALQPRGTTDTACAIDANQRGQIFPC